MASDKNQCFLCGEKINIGLLEKLSGTIIKIKNKDSSQKQLIKICSLCQKQHKDKLKQEVEKKAK